MEYKVGQTINSKALMGRIQFEMNKFLYIERFYIKISKEIVQKLFKMLHVH